ncbi:SDR family NAD(P)-dependent oxidoreductase [Lutimonas zeaxanthinifaciens]|uniref:SDR family NAD(P)-dependent oxidoreductase n=1 Tax=Lutimonas zeaxanthinifaciens TaxID=3060215 RepID=UPI00265CA970|nr:SDR family oxidoreductase [Lutimonas sp. YSD2104]WKK64609.1 SDR family oxidoreductase [Lutimonas sp. YSD2104]
MIQLDLSNKNILVTGASDGIGKEIARFLMEMNANVALHFFSNENSAKELAELYPSTNSRIFQADLESPKQAELLWNKVVEHYKTIDSVIFNAAVFLKHSTHEKNDEWFDIWNKTIRINLDSPGLISRMAVNHFKKVKGGRMVFIGSRAAFRGETEEYLAYAASKGGLTSLARSIARSFGKFNIKSFTIAPGFVKTKMAEQFINDYGEEKVLGELSLNRLTVPADISPLIGLICSGALDHATGSTIDLNAGSHIR